MTPQKLDQIARRMLVDILLEADGRYWLKRAEDFAKAGCDEIARACRAKAQVCRWSENVDEWAEMLDAELADVA